MEVLFAFLGVVLAIFFLVFGIVFANMKNENFSHLLIYVKVDVDLELLRNWVNGLSH